MTNLHVLICVLLMLTATVSGLDLAIQGSVSVNSPTGAGILPDKFQGVVMATEKKESEFILTVAAGKHTVTYTVLAPIDVFDDLKARYTYGSTHELSANLHALQLEPSLADQIRSWGHGEARVVKIDSGGSKIISIVRPSGEMISQKLKKGGGLEREFLLLWNHLADETTYLFPDALESALAGRQAEPRAPDKSSKPFQLLSRYVGSWQGRIDGRPDEQVEVHYQWHASGKALWRSMTWTVGKDEPPIKRLHYISYDAKTDTCLEEEHQKPDSGTRQHRWDEKSRSFVSEVPGQEQGQSIVTTATFTTEDRIDWKTVQQDARGTEKIMSSGHYQRIKK